MTARDSAPNKATRHRVLIIDDEESMRLYLARILATALKVEVTLAGTCEQALRLAGNYAYDAILLDLLMPGVGGFEVLAEIRRASPNAATPVIIVSVLSDQATKDRCMKSGANAYVVKPVEQLVSEVRRLEGLIREFLSFAREQRLDDRTAFTALRGVGADIENDGGAETDRREALPGARDRPREQRFRGCRRGAGRNDPERGRTEAGGHGQRLAAREQTRGPFVVELHVRLLLR